MAEQGSADPAALEFRCLCGSSFPTAQLLYDHAYENGHLFLCCCGELLGHRNYFRAHRRSDPGGRHVLTKLQLSPNWKDDLCPVTHIVRRNAKGKRVQALRKCRLCPKKKFYDTSTLLTHVANKHPAHEMKLDIGGNAYPLPAGCVGRTDTSPIVPPSPEVGFPRCPYSPNRRFLTQDGLQQHLSLHHCDIKSTSDPSEASSDPLEHLNCPTGASECDDPFEDGELCSALAQITLAMKDSSSDEHMTTCASPSSSEEHEEHSLNHYDPIKEYDCAECCNKFPSAHACAIHHQLHNVTGYTCVACENFFSSEEDFADLCNRELSATMFSGLSKPSSSTASHTIQYATRVSIALLLATLMKNGPDTAR
ncbi:uncharacterized protein LTR77_008005 [Saxophila tyrrhenica]|uniref:C2H2-type domain-containing protein n=1 Tax=Saxophila tyrrhenica TaxID=1690608 RepID=A0AAV9P2C8_9PEZI|nr:hypothetical protein LTR77_008005 [Saxophila tyrrhenica]